MEKRWNVNTRVGQYIFDGYNTQMFLTNYLTGEKTIALEI